MSWILRRPELIVAALGRGGWLDRTQTLMALVTTAGPANGSSASSAPGG